MQTSWVDFATVKKQVTMEMILNRYSINWLRKNGSELRGRCPIHQGEGKDTFHANFKKNAFNCFSCKAKGNVLDFVAAMEKSSVRDAALKLSEWFSLKQSVVPPVKINAQVKQAKAPEEGTEKKENVPLTFELRSVNNTHEYLAKRAITQETAEHFGIGLFSGRGLMAGRIVIPIHDDQSQLVAYAGRAINDEEPKYKFPPGFKKSHVLFNLNRVTSTTEEVVLVEGFFDCIQVVQAGHPCVALMGSNLSAEQEKLLSKKFRRVILLLDGDEPGRIASVSIAERLITKMFVKKLELSEGRQPDMLSTSELHETLSSS